jgi:hypothetical protein
MTLSPSLPIETLERNLPSTGNEGYLPGHKPVPTLAGSVPCTACLSSGGSFTPVHPPRRLIFTTAFLVFALSEHRASCLLPLASTSLPCALELGLL